MIYTIRLNLSVDSDRILSASEIVNLLYEKLDTPSTDVTDVELLDMYD